MKENWIKTNQIGLNGKEIGTGGGSGETSTAARWIETWRQVEAGGDSSAN